MATQHFALSCVLLALVAGCGGDDGHGSADATSEDAGYLLSGDTPGDENIATDLARYIHYNYGPPQGPDPELTQEEREKLGALADNVLGLRTSIEGISVSDSVITIETNLGESEQSTTTAELICTVIYGADVADRIEGHTVTAADGDLLVTCTHDTSPFESASLNPVAERLVQFSFTDLGASLNETRCAVEMFTRRVGVDELNAAAAEFKAGHPKRFMAHRLDLAAAAEECDVDDHRQADCDEPRNAIDRSLCREFERFTRNGPSPG